MPCKLHTCPRRHFLALRKWLQIHRLLLWIIITMSNQYQLNLQYNVRESFTSLQDDIVNFCKIISQYLLTLGDKYLRICYLAYFVWIYISAKMRMRQSSWKKNCDRFAKNCRNKYTQIFIYFFFSILNIYTVT